VLPLGVTIKLGVILPTSTPDPTQPILGDVRASARLAEEAGLDSVWSTDHLVASAPIMDAAVVLATAAAVTDRITIGFGVMLLALRPAAWAAKQVSSLQRVSGNRIALGVGTGNPAHGDIGWRAAGVPFRDRGRRTDEALRVLPALVTGQPAVLGDGLEVTLAPGSPMPPVIVAGNGDGRCAGPRPTATAGCASACRPRASPRASRRSAGLAAERGRPVPRVTVVGPVLGPGPGTAAARLGAYAAAGAERVIIVPSAAGWERDCAFAGELRAAL